MLNFSNILVAYDGSTSSMKAVKMGIEMKKQSNAALTILHVLEETTGYIPVQSTRPDTVPTGGMGSVDGLNIYTHNARDDAYREQKVAVQNATTEESINEVHSLLAQERVNAAVEVLHGDSKNHLQFCRGASNRFSDRW